MIFGKPFHEKLIVTRYRPSILNDGKFRSQSFGIGLPNREPMVLFGLHFKPGEKTFGIGHANTLADLFGVEKELHALALKVAAQEIASKTDVKDYTLSDIDWRPVYTFSDRYNRKLDHLFWGGMSAEHFVHSVQRLMQVRGFEKTSTELKKSKVQLPLIRLNSQIRDVVYSLPNKAGLDETDAQERLLELLENHGLVSDVRSALDKRHTRLVAFDFPYLQVIRKNDLTTAILSKSRKKGSVKLTDLLIPLKRTEEGETIDVEEEHNGHTNGLYSLKIRTKDGIKKGVELGKITLSLNGKKAPDVLEFGLSGPVRIHGFKRSDVISALKELAAKRLQSILPNKTIHSVLEQYD